MLPPLLSRAGLSVHQPRGEGLHSEDTTPPVSCHPVLFQALYNKIDTNDEGDISMRNVVEHIRAVEAGSGQNTWVNNRCYSPGPQYSESAVMPSVSELFGQLPAPGIIGLI